VNRILYRTLVGPPLATSDHNIISWNCVVDVDCKPTYCTKLNYGKANVTEIIAELQNIDWDILFVGDIHSCWQKFKITITKLECKYVPVITTASKGTSKPKWMKLVAKKRCVYKNYKSSSHPACICVNGKDKYGSEGSQEKF